MEDAAAGPMTARTFANGVLGGISGLFVLAAGYSVFRSGLGGVELLPCLAAALSTGLALRLQESRRVAAAMAVLASLVGLWAGDAVLAVRRPVPEAGRIARATAAGVTPDPRSMLEAVGDLRRAGVAAWPTVYVGNHNQFRDSLYPLASISGVTSVMCRETSFVVYRSDEYGFTNPPGQWRMRQADLALVGDSYVMGWCVRPRDSFAAAIRARYPATIVVGHGASGPLTQLAQMREFLPPLRPRHILWFYYEGNDLPDLTAENANPILPRYLEPDFTQHLTERQAEVDQRLRSFAVQMESTAVRDASAQTTGGWRGQVARGAWSVLTMADVRTRIAALLRPPRPRSCCDLALFRRVARAMQATVTGWGGNLTMVYLPSEARQASRPTLRTQRPEQSSDSVIAIADSLGVPVLDLRPALSRFGSAHDLYVYENAHFTERGHQAVATLVLEFLAHRDSLDVEPGAMRRAPILR